MSVISTKFSFESKFIDVRGSSLHFIEEARNGRVADLELYLIYCSSTGTPHT